MTQAKDSASAGSQDDAYRDAAAQFGDAIARLARGYEADPDLARDLVQDIHTELWRSFAYFEGQCSLRSWVYRIGHNVGVSHIQKAMRSKPSQAQSGLDEIDALAAPDNPEAEVGENQVTRRLMATIHRLKPADRQVMLLYLEDLSAAEIGDVTGLSSGAVATRIHRLKALLAEAFQPEDIDR
ncbi:RNA polymerase sigma factor [Aurantiacibacter gangjinensis]|uniref:Uncharacterized protein n=1 Tax=Aurantiacibacter gangjinensis TaxID=502682 RepID=A0A0G9MPI4_9SPHN|nr:RNA polymerase sigma factor [Aurantiacibacter gangjinensis]APE28395.1 RNA polymerase sigma-54 factor RpoN [Aurantiacibacter gangjinensis]KLE32622.1 hypothetical protein AAW01_00705 [Aurantiacibacter gangjinensis]